MPAFININLHGARVWRSMLLINRGDKSTKRIKMVLDFREGWWRLRESARC
ncbi:hypothetical protein [Anatilimnocola aggregata]|uniref:hypothetical protein n=1 Tax=Anatilimnocola aggregata TaxID=2528021 RepID=UPI00192E660F|nr:hypothetical protein [Anatilimnocola aggregata]